VARLRKGITSVILDPRDLGTLRNIAAQHGVSLAAVTRWAVEDYIERIRRGEVVSGRPQRAPDPEPVAV
jgi:uncharacterized protein YdbL (DUF1318 family)